MMPADNDTPSSELSMITTAEDQDQEAGLERLLFGPIRMVNHRCKTANTQVRSLTLVQQQLTLIFDTSISQLQGFRRSFSGVSAALRLVRRSLLTTVRNGSRPQAALAKNVLCPLRRHLRQQGHPQRPNPNQLLIHSWLRDPNSLRPASRNTPHPPLPRRVPITRLLSGRQSRKGGTTGIELKGLKKGRRAFNQNCYNL